MTALPTSSLEAMGAQVTELSAALSAHLKAAGAAEPTLAADTPLKLPDTHEVQATRLQLLDVLRDMAVIVQGPSDNLFETGFATSHDPFILDAFNQFDFYGAVPLSGSASFTEVAAHTGLPEQTVRRLLRYGMANRWFAPDPAHPDRVIHTSISAHYVLRPNMRSFIAHCTEEIRPGALHGVGNLWRHFWSGAEADPERLPSQEKGHCGIVDFVESDERLRGLGIVSIFSWFEKDFDLSRPGRSHPGWRAKRFAEAMEAVASASPTQTLVEMYDWEALGDATVIDLGGSAGHISAMIGRNHPRLSFIVQDLPEVEDSFNSFKTQLPAELASRLKYQVHNFLTVEPVSAAVYFLKSVLHDWSDKDAAHIIARLVPAMRPGARVVLCEQVLPPDRDDELTAAGQPPVPRSVRRVSAGVDMQMHIAFNARERTVADWTAAAKAADSRFNLGAVKTVSGSSLGLIEFVFSG